MLLIVCWLLTLCTSVVELLEVLFEIPSNLWELLAVLGYVPFLIADVALDEERLVVFVIILNLLLDWMELG
jgi:hypothetical protein